MRIVLSLQTREWALQDFEVVWVYRDRRDPGCEMRQNGGKAVRGRSLLVCLVYSCMERRTGVPDDGTPSLLEDAPHTAVRKHASDGRNPETAVQLCDAAGGQSLKDVERALVRRVGERVALHFGFDEIDRVDESPTGDAGCVEGARNQLSLRLRS